MANLTLSIDDELLKRARVKALEQGSSVNAVVREHLRRYVTADRRGDPLKGFLELAERSQAFSGPHGRTWTREEIYEERLGRYGRR